MNTALVLCSVSNSHCQTRHDKTVLSVSCQAVRIESRDRLAKSEQLAGRSPSSRRKFRFSHVQQSTACLHFAWRTPSLRVGGRAARRSCNAWPASRQRRSTGRLEYKDLANSSPYSSCAVNDGGLSHSCVNLSGNPRDQLSLHRAV